MKKTKEFLKFFVIQHLKGVGVKIIMNKTFSLKNTEVGSKGVI